LRLEFAKQMTLLAANSMYIHINLKNTRVFALT
jgi:hypothetical protein